MQQQPVFHFKFRIPLDQLAFQFEHDHGNSLEHPCLYRKIGIRFCRKQGQLPQRNTVSPLQNFCIAIGKGIAQYPGNTARAASSGTHPQDVVIAPLDIHGVMTHQDVHDAVRPRPSVENIAHYMKQADGKVLDKHRESNDQAVAGAGCCQRINKDVMVTPPVVLLLAFRPRFVGLVVHELIQ